MVLILPNRSRRVMLGNSSNRRKDTCEDIIRKSLRQTAKDYLQECTLSGCRHLVEPGRYVIERLIWLAAIITSVYYISSIIQAILMDFYNRPIYEYLEDTQYEVWNVPFPSIAVCNVNKISQSKALTYATLLARRNLSHLKTVDESEEVKKLMKEFLHLGHNIDHEPTDGDKFMDILNTLHKYDSTFGAMRKTTHNLMKMLSPNCEEMLVRCSWLGKMVNCSEIMFMRRTSEGFCCTFNYYKSYDAYQESQFKHKEYIKAKGSSFVLGLSLIVNLQLEDFYYPIRNAKAVNVLFFKPKDYPDATTGGVIERLALVDHETFFSVEPKTFYSDSTVKKLPIKKRRCMFEDENYKKFHGQYSFSNCVVHCKIKTIKTLCKCTPFYYPSLDNATPYCNLDNIPCLNKYRNKFRSILGTDFDDDPSNYDIDGFEESYDGMRCDCYPDCSTTTYKIQTTKVPLGFSKKEIGFKANISKRGYSIFHIFYGKTNSDLFVLNVRYQFIEILGFVGGTVGLFMGFSVISVVEFLYFFIVRFIIKIRRNMKNNSDHTQNQKFFFER